MTTAETQTTPAMSANPLEDLDRRHLVHPHQSKADTERTVIVSGTGCTVRDTRGRDFLDVSGAGNWACQIGYGRTEVVEAGAEQLRDLAYFSGFFGFSNDKSVRLAERLAALAPDDMNRVFFTGSGSEGVETAIKAARLYHHHRGEPDRTWIISRSLAYHGATYGSGTTTGFPPMQEGVGPNLPHVAKVSPPYPYRAEEMYGGEDPTDFLIRELETTIQELGPGRVAAMIGEPVMGGGGILVPPADYWPRVRELLNQHGILLIADEVVTAFGRTGAWLDSPGRGMAPDIIVTAKGLTSGYAPLGAVLFRDTVAETAAADYFFHGHTYSAHPTCCAVALANLEVLEKEGLIDQAHLVAEWFREDLPALLELPMVGDIRIEGATAGIELVAGPNDRTPVMAGAVTAEMRHAHRIILREYGPTVVLSPPLVISREEVRRTTEALSDVISRLRSDGTVGR